MEVVIGVLLKGKRGRVFSRPVAPASRPVISLLGWPAQAA